MAPPKRCPLHGCDLKDGEADVMYGLPAEEFFEALRESFPHALIVLGGCILPAEKERHQKRRVMYCEECQASLNSWGARD